MTFKSLHSKPGGRASSQTLDPWRQSSFWSCSWLDGGTSRASMGSPTQTPGLRSPSNPSAINPAWKKRGNKSPGHSLELTTEHPRPSSKIPQVIAFTGLWDLRDSTSVGDLFVFWSWAYRRLLVVQAVGQYSTDFADKEYESFRDRCLEDIQSCIDAVDFEHEDGWAYLVTTASGPRIIHRRTTLYRIPCDFLWAPRVDISEVDLQRIDGGHGLAVWRGKDVDVHFGFNDVELYILESEMRGRKAVRGMDISYNLVAHVFRGEKLIGMMKESSRASRPVRATSAEVCRGLPRWVEVPKRGLPNQSWPRCAEVSRGWVEVPSPRAGQGRTWVWVARSVDTVQGIGEILTVITFGVERACGHFVELDARTICFLEHYLAVKLALNFGEMQEFRFGVHDLAEPNRKFRFRVLRKGPRTRTEPNFDITRIHPIHVRDTLREPEEFDAGGKTSINITPTRPHAAFAADFELLTSTSNSCRSSEPILLGVTDQGRPSAEEARECSHSGDLIHQVVASGRRGMPPTPLIGQAPSARNPPSACLPAATPLLKYDNEAGEN
ncbi:hypothetical protein FB45DRAFT_1016069 [Roridomyces roridus]|uniref:Uncharacterized protein n=1 Tax=Roridomyces roridus TaxID=1738132 RepID=A0AAD7F7C6_9AGAR|nr:hypothetical protein FB45DRAFT_1016069 [Roridomyces roridus]